MYKCYNPKKFLLLVAFDTLLIITVFLICKNLFGMKSQAGTEKDGVFVPAIMYHSVYTDTSQSTEFIVTPQTLESDLKYLKSHGYTAVLPQDLVLYADGKGNLPEKPILLTFDDGNYNNMYYLLPLIEKYDMKANINVVGAYTDFFSTNGEEHIEKYSYLTWDDIALLAKGNLIEIGNHTYNLHSNTERKGCAKFSYETEEQYSSLLKKDVGRLQTELIEKSNVNPITFAYPFGYISKESKPALKELGFRVLLTCYERPNYITQSPGETLEINRYNRPNDISTENFMNFALNIAT